MDSESQQILEAAKSAGYYKPEELVNDLLKILPKLQQEAKNNVIKHELRVVEETKNNFQIHLIIFYHPIVIHLKFLRNYPEPGCFQLECKNPLVAATAQRLFYLFPTFKLGLSDLVQRLLRDIAHIEYDEEDTEEQKNDRDFPIVDFAQRHDLNNSYNQSTDAKRQKIHQASNLFPFDILSKICSFLPECGWFKFAAVNKQFNRVLFQGTENILYPINYLFAHMPTLVQQKHHSKLEQLLEQIAKLKLSMHAKVVWTMQSTFHPYWTLNQLLVAANHYPTLFNKHIGAMEMLMDNFLWHYQLALNCTLVPQISWRGSAVSPYYDEVFLDSGPYAAFKNKNATEETNSIGDIFEGDKDRGFWTQIAYLYSCTNETTDDPILTRITKTLNHCAKASKEELPSHAEEMVPAATDVLLAVIETYDREDDDIDKAVHALLGFAAAHSSRPTTHLLAKKLVTKCIRRSIHITIPPELLADEQFLLQLIERKPEAFMKLPESQRNNLQLAELAILGEVTTTGLTAGIPYHKYKTKPCAEMVKHLVQLQSNRAFMLAVLKTHPLQLPNITFRSDTSFFKEALLANPRVMENKDISTTGLDRTFLHQLMDKILSGDSIINYNCNWLEDVAISIGALDQETLLKLMKLCDCITDSPLMPHVKLLEADPSMHHKLIRCCPKYAVGHFAKANVDTLLSHKEQQDLVKLALMDPWQHLQCLPAELYHKFKATIEQQVIETPDIHFCNLPSYARSDVDLCAAVLQKNIKLAYQIGPALLMDTHKVIELLSKVPELLQLDIVHFRLHKLDIIKSYLTNAPYRSFTDLTAFEWGFYLDLPAVIRRDERFQKKIHAQWYLFTEDAISGNNGLLISTVDDDEQQQANYEEILRSIAKPFKCIWKCSEEPTKETSEWAATP